MISQIKQATYMMLNAKVSFDIITSKETLMKNNKIVLYAIYFLLLNINKMAFRDIAGNRNIAYAFSLILITLSIVLDVRLLLKQSKK